ncbi:MAG: hypothetical protein ACK56I_24185, partial [bacterium]
MAGDFVFTGAAGAVGDGYFADAESPLQGTNLHFDGPAVVAVPHVESGQAGSADGAEGAKIGIG